ncbi:putative metalloproteinase [Chlamydia pneumoniae TW-183]|uniref:4-hydroxy-3-methylbut-2-enyl diphosphate reductase n=2 Tax=Chlamydia pneumoniae TaxID=83558 RepID=ISPH_CHLPN|nr:4-hydroxy-3-methylbut-2-enyl diphosphate reductase [Chlamydia pneumoniae]Q9Z6P2.1 RecName: Full=4-hydroxy-3-methylbut-2-enyl diphosphate reductase; Short=HMBPP reductase [Chlamydia pneumoniae]AAD19154.1 Metalloprotease [Chlamydia pneumoniae CWL029]AAF38629.1 penicillin tolerance protein LytB [Chlamydia pneumoniae AR39]AAP98984.1 putative metalloproteinase [Chlamydia pneumoniae TW-183]ACZ32919.1 4-hydroxy-3-methylbut-2-enyl diphosphate reductase [Chlamydia pneumoniae LPCoLN]ETR79804.1 4-hyd
MRKLILCNPRGFCSGVVRAIQVVEVALEKWGAPIYVKHEIVHNRHVVNALRAKGAIFVEELVDVPEGERVIYSAHGIPPSVRAEAKARKLIDIDATCGLVTKVHSAAKLYASKGYKIILIGHKKHVEVIGIVGEVPEHITVVEKVADVEALPFSSDTPLFYITQTTLSLDDVQEISSALLKRYPSIITLPSSSICYATTNRQKALRSVLSRVNYVYVVGDVNSSNSNRLREVALRRGVPADLINNPEDIDTNIVNHSGDIAMTAGASTPEDVVQACIRKLSSLIPGLQVENDIFAVEDVVFQLPKELRCS